MAPDFESFTAFLKLRRKDLARIAHRTWGETTLEDIENDAWETAYAIGMERGAPMSFQAAVDQQLLLGRLYNRLVKYSEKSVRYAVRVDHHRAEDSEELGSHPLIDMLKAPGDDPLGVLEDIERHQEDRDLLTQSYSEAVAYLWLLTRFGWDSSRLAADLGIKPATLRVRLGRTVALFEHQPTLFDGKEVIDPDFTPARRKAIHISRSVAWQWEQSTWHF